MTVLLPLTVTLAFGSLGVGHTVPDTDKLSINVLHTSGNRSPESSLDQFLDMKILYSRSCFESRMENLSELTSTATLLTVKTDVLFLRAETGWTE